MAKGRVGHRRASAARRTSNLASLRSLIIRHQVASGLFAGAIVLAIIGLMASFFIGAIRSTVATATYDSINELAEHDTRLIEFNLESKWGELRSIAQKLESERPETILDIQIFLNHECAASGFKAIYIVDEDNQLYTDALRVLQTKLPQIETMLEDGSGQFVVPDTRAHTFRELSQSLLTYGVALPADYLHLAGKHFVCLMGIDDIASLADKLRINSFDNRGWSSVITSAGDYVIADSALASFTDVKNLYVELEEGSPADDGPSISQIVDGMKNRDTFSFNWVSPEGEVISALSRPLENTDWNFVTFVPQSIFYEQSWHLIAVTSAMIIVVLLGMAILVAFIYVVTIHALQDQAMAQTRTEFLSNMSHEIRTPINGIVGLNYLMEANIDDKERLKELLHQNETTTKYLLSLVNDILDLNKLESGKYEVLTDPCSIQRIVGTVESMEADVFKAKGIDFVVEADIPYPHVLGDETHIKQVLMNILSNASKFTPEGGTVTFRTSQRMDEPTGRAVTTFTISDTGCGMTEEYRKHIFEAFSQDRNASKSSIKGTGLGMAISSMLTKLMGGTIEVESELGVGSTFTVTLPLEVTEAFALDEGADDETSRAIASELHPGRPLHLLVAEDNQLNAAILVEILEEEGMTVDHAADGSEAVRLFADSEPFTYDLVLMDVLMPEMNGYEATEAIRALDRPDARSTIIYACTANSYKEDRDMAYEAGMDGFLTKPIEIDEMLRMLRRAIERERRP